MPILAPATIDGNIVLIEFHGGKRPGYAAGDALVFRVNGESRWQHGEVTKYVTKTGAVEIKVVDDERARIGHEWFSKQLISPVEKIVRTCRHCGVLYRGFNENYLCGAKK